MNLYLARIWLDSISTCGGLFVENTFEDYTLELPAKDGKPGSAILPGTYQVVLAESPKFMLNPDPWVQKYAKAMLRLVDVPYRDGILLHWGDFAANTEGCPLIGCVHNVDGLAQSRAAFDSFYPKVHDAAARADLKITIIGGDPK